MNFYLVNLLICKLKYAKCNLWGCGMYLNYADEEIHFFILINLHFSLQEICLKTGLQPLLAFNSENRFFYDCAHWLKFI